MIIGINGKIGSGKDTIGKIVQYLTTHPYDVNIQTYLDKEVNGQFEIKSNVHTIPIVKIKKFAGKMKKIASILTGIPVEKFEDQEFKECFLDVEWGTVQNIPLNSIPPFADMQFNVMMTVREFLQKLGTEAMRDGLHADVWVNALFADYKKKSNWIITDMRFPNEMKAIVKRQGITIRVVRPSFIAKDPHPSETALDDAKFDYEIINDGSMEKLVKKVRKILIKEKLI